METIAAECVHAQTQNVYGIEFSLVSMLWTILYVQNTKNSIYIVFCIQYTHCRVL